MSDKTSTDQVVSWKTEAVIVMVVALILVIGFSYQPRFTMATTIVVVAIWSAWASYIRTPAGKMIIVNWKLFFSPNPPEGHIIALEYQQGIWARPLKTKRWIPFGRLPFMAELRQSNLVTIPPNKVGILQANDGMTAPSGFVVSPKNLTPHELEDGELALLAGMDKILQKAVLRPGVWRINAKNPTDPNPTYPHTWLYNIILEDFLDVDPRAVVVLISNIGGIPTGDTTVLYWGNGPGEYSGAILGAPTIEGVKCRGILPFVLQPGQHAINRETGTHPGAFKTVLVDTSTNTVHLDKHPVPDQRNHHKIEPIQVRSEDGISVLLEIEIAFKVRDIVKTKKINTNGDITDEDITLPGAVLVVAHGGTLNDLVRDILVPIAKAVILAMASKIKLQDLLASRGKSESEANERKQEREIAQVKILNALTQAIEGSERIPEASEKRIAQFTQEQRDDITRTVSEIVRLIDPQHAYPEIEIQTLGLIATTEGHAGAQKFEEAINTTARQPAERKRIIAETETAKANIELEKAETQAENIGKVVNADLESQASVFEKVTLKNRMTAKIEALGGPANLGTMAQAFVVLDDLINKRLSNEGESSRDKAVVAEKKVDIEQQRAANETAQPQREKRKPRKQNNRGGKPQPSPSSPPAEVEDEDDDDDDEPEGAQ